MESGHVSSRSHVNVRVLSFIIGERGMGKKGVSVNWGAVGEVGEVSDSKSAYGPRAPSVYILEGLWNFFHAGNL